MSDIKARILEIVSTQGPISALEITRIIYNTYRKKSEVNAILYKLQRYNQIIRTESNPPLWYKI